MAMINAETAQGFSGLPVLKQLGLMVALAASVALGVAVVMWSQEPSYTLLYGNLSGTDSSQVLDSLQKANIPYKVEEGSGAIMVASDKIHKARLKLAADGLPKGNGVGFELFDKEQSLGTSKFIERARYQHASEIELARSITTMQSIRKARVHLAIPKKSVFIRKQGKPTASVVLDLYSGHKVASKQVAAIVHLVSSSVPGLMPDSVTVVDQMGNLLSRESNNDMMSATTDQFEYTRKLEATYRQRIEDLLTPIVGPGRVRAQVFADIDFTATEKTRESYNPDLPALRSEQLVKQTNGGVAVSGVPGALSNQPPAAGSTTAPGAANTGKTGSSSSRTTRNYELDKTISHTRSSVGTIRKISVAVLVDDLKKTGADGKVTSVPLNSAALARLNSLVKETVGFNQARGDSVNVINASFYVPEKQEDLPEPGFMENPMIQNIIKQSLGGLVVLILIFAVLKPALRNLTNHGAASQQQATAGQISADDLGEDQVQISGGESGEEQALLAAPNPVDQQIAVAQNLVQQDPARVAQVVKTWVGSDG